MRTITIHNPYAHLILTPQSELPPGAVHKRVENRRWTTTHRGPLAIHAGRSLDWFAGGDWPLVPQKAKLTFADFPDMTFGAVLGVVDLVTCVPIELVRRGEARDFDWLKTHVHASGPWCWILANPRRLATPVPMPGQQGLFEVKLPELEALAG